MCRLYLGLFLTVCVVSVVLSFPEPHELVQRNGNPRSSRGFQVQNGKLSTARGFGKRGNNGGGGSESIMNRPPSSSLLLDNMNNFPSTNIDSKTSYANAWLVDEIQTNPETARFIIEKFVDENGDGEITTEELSRPSGFL